MLSKLLCIIVIIIIVGFTFVQMDKLKVDSCKLLNVDTINVSEYMINTDDFHNIRKSL